MARRAVRLIAASGPYDAGAPAASRTRMTTKMAASPPPVGRLAPSPTGLLHLGHARSFLLAWWHARAAGGSVVMRMEDLDGERARDELADAALRDLEWLGLDWDGGVVRQSAGLEHLTAALDALLARGLAYPCVCTRGELRGALSAPQQGDGEVRYPGTCRGRFQSREEAERTSRQPAGLRFLVDGGPVVLDDRLAGTVRFDIAQEVGDFLIATKRRAPAYQLAVVVDDARAGVTEVVRGDDLLSSAARQRLLQDALGLPHVDYFHVPLVVDASGRRLAKRERDLGLAELRAGGTDPRALVAWAARSAGLSVDERVTAREVLPIFTLERLPRAPSLLDAPTLAALRSAR